MPKLFCRGGVRGGSRVQGGASEDASGRPLLTLVAAARPCGDTVSTSKSERMPSPREWLWSTSHNMAVVEGSKAIWPNSLACLGLLISMSWWRCVSVSLCSDAFGRVGVCVGIRVCATLHVSSILVYIYIYTFLRAVDSAQGAVFLVLPVGRGPFENSLDSGLLFESAPISTSMITSCTQGFVAASADTASQCGFVFRDRALSDAAGDAKREAGRYLTSRRPR